LPEPRDRYFPRDLTIGAVFDHQVDIDGRPERLGDLVEEFRGFVVDRLVALSLYLLRLRTAAGGPW
jgi:hypothetical protein